MPLRNVKYNFSYNYLLFLIFDYLFLYIFLVLLADYCLYWTSLPARIVFKQFINSHIVG